jgi:hypothetical protein
MHNFHASRQWYGASGNKIHSFMGLAFNMKAADNNVTGEVEAICWQHCVQDI